jgi:hypothetical protein
MTPIDSPFAQFIVQVVIVLGLSRFIVFLLKPLRQVRAKDCTIDRLALYDVMT